MSRRIVSFSPSQNRPAQTLERAPAQQPHPSLAALARLLARMAVADATKPLADTETPPSQEISDDEE